MVSVLQQRMSKVEKELTGQAAAGVQQALRKELAAQGERLGMVESATGRLQAALRAAADSFA